MALGRLKFQEFDWDGGNAAKCLGHDVSRREIEDALSGPVLLIGDPDHSGSEIRFRAIGRTSTGRHLFTVVTFRQREGRVLVRPISARYMHGKEIARYEQTVAPPEQ